MAYVYSLICWGGLTGKTVSVAASTDVVTLTNHGITTIKKVWPSGVLPQELNSLTPVYACPTGQNTFTLHASYLDAGTGNGQIKFAGSSTYSIKLKSDLVADPVNSLAQYGIGDLSRWSIPGGGYRVYDSIASCIAARGPASDYFDEDVWEIGECFDEYSNPAAIDLKSASLIIHSKINGSRSDGYHLGLFDFGYRFVPTSSGSINLKVPNSILDGIGVRISTSRLGVALSAAGSKVVNCIIDGSGGTGIALISTLCDISYCQIFGATDGIKLYAYNYYSRCVNNIIAGCSSAFSYNSGNNTNCFGKYYNNICIGNTVNWPASAPSGMEDAGSNAGEASDTPWRKGVHNSIVVTQNDFYYFIGKLFFPREFDGTYPVQVDSGIRVYGVSPFDIVDGEVPGYNNGGYEGVDIGPFEFNHGYGNHPNITALTIAAQVQLNGAEIRIYDLDNSPAGSLGTDLAGTESCATHTYEYSGQAGNVIWLQVMQSGYVEFGQPITIPADDTTVAITLSAELNN